MYLLYVHFPFCQRKCQYCDFCSFPAGEAVMAAYCETLEKEMALAAPAFAGERAETVFFGGGTPSVLPAALMRRVTDALHRHFDIQPGAEFTSEANPGTLREDWLDVMAGAGMNRLSLGVQAKQEPLLRTLGRIHSFEQALDALAAARRHGVDNLNCDAMFGLPGQTKADYLDTLAAFAEAGVSHISAYSLILEEHTPLHRLVTSGALTLPDDDAVADMLESGVTELAKRGYRRYEISNFSHPGRECAHNLGYWQGKRYLGLGLNAASLLDAAADEPGALYTRVSNTADLDTYLRALNKGRLPRLAREPIGREEAMYETLMLGLRTARGVDERAFEARFGVSLASLYGARIAALRKEGWIAPLQAEHPFLALTDGGLNVQSAVLLRLTDGL
ncbi:MAG: radical SAM family heme chaperone HemW [Eubacteriales bacterium]|nr:radical SAM family heme chaperone HemW [Eubacteriales bacterium]